MCGLSIGNMGSLYMALCRIVLDEKPGQEKGCAMDTVGALAEVHVVVKVSMPVCIPGLCTGAESCVRVQGLVDASKEIEKATKQLTMLMTSRTKLQQQMCVCAR